MKKLLLILICLFVSFEVRSKDIKSITKLIDYEKCMKELENNLPTKKNIFIGKKIKIYLDKNNNWLYETKKEMKLSKIKS